MLLTVGITIEGGHVIEQVLFDDGVYQWVQARSPSGIAFLQVPSTVLSSDEIKSLFAAFQALDARAIPAILTPQQKLASGPYPFIGVYPNLPLKFLVDSSAELEPNVKADRWVAACLTLRGLHNAQLVHGRIDTRSFRVNGTNVLLGGFGFAPLIALGNRAALAAAQECLAPEIRDGGQPTKASDIYAFGKLVLQAFPHLRGTSWAETACATDPARRFSIDDIRRELRPLLTVPHQDDGTIDVDIEHPIEHPVTVISAPSGGGTVSGEGWYHDGTTATFHAKPLLGYAFSRWSGDISGTQNPITKRVTENLTITAHFVPTAPQDPPSSPPSFLVAVTVEPTRSGTVAGTGSYERNRNASLEATPASGYKFSHWSGDLAGSDNPIRQSITKNVAATAHFTPVDPIFTVIISQNMPFGGSVTGAGSYKTGTTAVLTATPNTGFLFTGWSGDLTGPKTTKSVMVTKNITARANFRARPRFSTVRLLVIAALVIAFFAWKHPSPPSSSLLPPIPGQPQKDEKNAKDEKKKVIVKTPSPPKPIPVKKFDPVQSAKDAEQSNILVNRAQADYARLDPQHSSIASKAAVAQECKQAVSHAQKAISEDPSDRDAWEHAYDAYYLLGKDYYKDCEALRERAAKRFPNYAYFSTSGVVYINMQEHIRQQQKRIHNQ